MSTDRVDGERTSRGDTVIDVPSEKISDDPKSAAWGWFVDFANNSSLHGIKYFGERRRHWSERMFWILSLLISVGGCSVMIRQNYQSWLNDLIVIGFDKDSTHVSSVPFPAVTICSETKVRNEQVNLTDAWNISLYYWNKDWSKITDKPTVERRKALYALVQICEPTFFYDYTDSALLEADRIVPLLRDIAPYKIFDKSCSFKGEIDFCKKFFHETFTDEGVCFTFNSLTFNEIFKEEKLADDFKSMYKYSDSRFSEDSASHYYENNENKVGGILKNGSEMADNDNDTDNKHENADYATLIERLEKLEDAYYIKEMKHGRENFGYYETKLSSDTWSVDSGYKTTASETYPQRVLGAGNNFRLELFLKTRKADLSTICRKQQGYKVMLHNPGEIPRLSQKFFRVPLGKQIDLRVKPIVVTTSEGLAAYSPERRQCYFSDERDLKFFKIYTQYHCELECLATHTLKKCKCVKFSMPRDNTTKICSLLDMDCYNSIEAEMLKLQLNLSDSTRKSLCGCLPSCSFISYDADVSEADNYSRQTEDLLDINSSRSSRMFSKLLIYFKENEFPSLKRSELNGTAGFISNCGGLLGVFLGVSILTFVEIFYYITLRLFCRYKVRKNQK